jgi:hypothetical protein
VCAGRCRWFVGANRRAKSGEGDRDISHAVRASGSIGLEIKARAGEIAERNFVIHRSRGSRHLEDALVFHHAGNWLTIGYAVSFGNPDTPLGDCSGPVVVDKAQDTLHSAHAGIVELLTN